jgi:hypothetical protein
MNFCHTNAGKSEAGRPILFQPQNLENEIELFAMMCYEKRRRSQKETTPRPTCLEIVRHCILVWRQLLPRLANHHAHSIARERGNYPE